MSTHARAQRKSKLISRYHLTDDQAVRFLKEYDHLIPFRPGQMARCVESWKARESRGAAHRSVAAGERIRLVQLFREQMVAHAEEAGRLDLERRMGEMRVEAASLSLSSALDRERLATEARDLAERERYIAAVPKVVRDAEEQWHWQMGRFGEPSYWLVHTDSEERWPVVETLGQGIGVTVRGERLVLCGLLGGRIAWLGLPELGTGQFAGGDVVVVGGAVVDVVGADVVGTDVVGADVAPSVVTAVESPPPADACDPVRAEGEAEVMYRVQEDEAEDSTDTTDETAAELRGLQLSDPEEGCADDVLTH